MYPIDISICTILFLLIYMSCFHCAVWCSDRCIVFSKLVKWKVLLKLYFERYNFTFHFTKFLSHFLNKLMLNRNYFIILSVVKKSVSHCAYIPSRNREKQLCNMAIKSHQKPFWKRVRTCKKHCNTKIVTVNWPKTVLFPNFD